MSVEDVERILDETREAAEYQAEINSLISGQLSDTDMDEVEAELDALIAADVQQLPDVPNDQPHIVADTGGYSLLSTGTITCADASSAKDKPTVADEVRSKSRQAAKRKAELVPA
jgi:hypothetical protein